MSTVLATLLTIFGILFLISTYNHWIDKVVVQGYRELVQALFSVAGATCVIVGVIELTP